MKKILILSFLYENALCLKEFELLKTHYNNIINNFYFPIKYYGVRATENDETRIDEKNQIIWLHTNDIKEYDKQLTTKVIDCFKYIQNRIEYDIVIKTNTSFVMNLVHVNKMLQPAYTEDCIFTGIKYQCKYKNYENYIDAYRGNFVTFGKEMVEYIVNNFHINELVENVSLLFDDTHISVFLDNRYLIVSLGQFAVTHQHELYPYTSITDITQILKSIGVCVKVYTDKNYSHENYSENELDSFSPDITFMKIFIKYLEDAYIQPAITKLITGFTCE